MRASPPARPCGAAAAAPGGAAGIGVVLLALLLALATGAAFGPVLGAGFVDFDDDRTVTGNPAVLGGLTAAGAAWALHATAHANWHPLTWLSHQLDVTLFGLRPAGHHATSLLLHALNASLLFLALRALTGATWRALAASALFALHPLRVESVAWVSERKDVLAGAWAMLTLLAYASYARRPGAGRYAAVALTLAAGLASKPMLVTLPLALLLLDFWPLGRWRPAAAAASPLRLVLEKAPLLALSAAASWVTWSAQAASGALDPLAASPVGERLVRVPLAYLSYLRRTVWPVDLAALYPLPPTPPSPADTAVAAAVLAGALAGALALWRRRPALAAGGLWFLGMLVPVIGLVQAGTQFVADRYTYLPHVGLFVAAVWGAPGPGGARARPLGAALLAPALAALAALSWVQAGRWRDSETLFTHTLAVTRDNWFISYNLGVVLAGQGRHGEAVTRYREALRVRPGFGQARGNLGVSLAALGRDREAVAEYRGTLRVLPRDPITHYNLALSLERLGDLQPALEHYAEAARLDPRSVEARIRLGRLLAGRGRVPEARAALEEALRLRPGAVEARRLLSLLGPSEPAR